MQVKFDTVAAGFGIAFGQALFGVVAVALYLTINAVTDGFLS